VRSRGGIRYILQLLQVVTWPIATTNLMSFLEMRCYGGFPRTPMSSPRRKLHHWVLVVLCFAGFEGSAFARKTMSPLGETMAPGPMVEAVAVTDARLATHPLPICHISHHPRTGTRSRVCPLFLADVGDSSASGGASSGG
jgi:hypothetical protein